MEASLERPQAHHCRRFLPNRHHRRPGHDSPRKPSAAAAAAAAAAGKGDVDVDTAAAAAADKGDAVDVDVAAGSGGDDASLAFATVTFWLQPRISR